VIIVTRLSGQKMAVNSDLIERIESTPDTILVMADGSRHLVSESLEETVELVAAFRSHVIARALDAPTDGRDRATDRRADALRLVTVSGAHLGDA